MSTTSQVKFGFSAFELSNKILIGKAIAVAGVAALGAYVYKQAVDTYSGAGDFLALPKWGVTGTMATIMWLVFYALFTWAWYVTCGSSSNIQLTELLFGGTLVMLVAWSVSAFKLKDIKAARIFSLVATLMLAVNTVHIWKQNQMCGIMSLILTAWLAYNTGVAYKTTVRDAHVNAHDEE